MYRLSPGSPSLKIDAAAGEREHLELAGDRLDLLLRDPLEQPGLREHLVHYTSSRTD